MERCFPATPRTNSMTSAPRDAASLPVRTALLCASVLTVHTLILVQVLHAPRHVRNGSVIRLFNPLALRTRRDIPAPGGDFERRNASLPPLFIYRRSKKTGSTSMVDGLIAALAPFGYAPFPYKRDDLSIALHHEFVRTDGGAVAASGAARARGRLMVLHHNDVTRAAHPRRDALIADTFRDGFSRITSFCRHMGRAKTCGDDLVACMRSPAALAELRYRWAGREIEDADTYVDLPLNSKFPALSTTVLRTVFPDAVLRLARYNARDTACNATKTLTVLYKSLYGGLDRQVETLSKRMLVIAGYPTAVKRTRGGPAFSVEDMLHAAEEAEIARYPQLVANGAAEVAAVRSDPQRVVDMREAHLKWWTDENGKLVAGTRGGANLSRRDVHSGSNSQRSL